MNIDVDAPPDCNDDDHGKVMNFIYIATENSKQYNINFSAQVMMKSYLNKTQARMNTCSQVKVSSIKYYV